MAIMRHSWCWTLTLCLLVGSGCSETTKTDPVTSSQNKDHDHEAHDHGPESLTDALAELTSMRNTIRDSFAKNDQDAAHGPLHEVGAILEAIPDLAKKEKVSAENQAAIETAVNTLMDAFGNVDKTMHGQEGSTYSEESATIDTTLTALSAACAADSAPAVDATSEEKSEAP